MHKNNKPVPKFKFIDLSSQSDSDSDKENNVQAISRTTNKTYTGNAPNRPITHQLNPKQQQTSSIINRSVTPLKEAQFSTLSLEEQSVTEYHQYSQYSQNQQQHQHESDAIIFENQTLNRQNEEMKKMNQKLERQLEEMTRINTQLAQQIGHYQDRIDEDQRYIQQLKSQIRQEKNKYERTVREYQNKIVNSQLPNAKILKEEVNKVMEQISNNIKSLSLACVNNLKKQRMNPKVESIIQNFIQQISELKPYYNSYNSNKLQNPQQNEEENKFRSKASTSKAYRSQRMNELVNNQNNNSNISAISQDYRLMTKSIQKLKQMDKDIQECNGSYLSQQKFEESVTANKSSILDQSSIGDMGRSKSKRRPIFK